MKAEFFVTFMAKRQADVSDEATRKLLHFLDLALNPMYTESQIIAAAIATYVANNKLRRGTLYTRRPLPAINFPATTIVNNSFTFYKFTVTAELSTAVQQGTFKYVPHLPRRHMPGMYPLENKVEFLACFEALTCGLSCF